MLRRLPWIFCFILPFGCSSTGGAAGNGGGGGSGASGTMSGTSSTQSGPGSGSVGSGGAGAGSTSGTSSASSSGAGGGPACTSDQTIHQGKITYYQPSALGHCSFESATLPPYFGAMNTPDYALSAVCGACVQVTGPEGSVDIKIVDECPDAQCTSGHIDLNLPAFDAVADPAQGIVPVMWKYIPCDVMGPIAYHFKDGSSRYWTAVQIRNHRHAIKSVELQPAGGSFRNLDRVDYNFFIDTADIGPGPYTLRVTDIYDQVLEDSGIAYPDPNVPLASGWDVPGSGQFPACN